MPSGHHPLSAGFKLQSRKHLGIEQHEKQKTFLLLSAHTIFPSFVFRSTTHLCGKPNTFTGLPHNNVVDHLGIITSTLHDQPVHTHPHNQN